MYDKFSAVCRFKISLLDQIKIGLRLPVSANKYKYIYTYTSKSMAHDTIFRATLQAKKITRDTANICLVHFITIY